MEILKKITNRELILKKVYVEKLLFHSDGDELEFKSNVKYKIKKNKNNEIIISLNIESGFIPETAFKAVFDFDMIISCDCELEENEIEKSIDDVLYPVGSELSLLIANISRNMIGNPIIVPPNIDEYERI